MKVNPLQARRFAEACGTRAKTDALDARGLARMGQTLELEPDVPVSKTTRVLKDLQLARTALIKDRTRLRNRSHIQTNKVLQRQTKARLTLVEKQIDQLDEEIGKLINTCKTTARNRDILRSIPGIGQVASAAIVTFLPEIGTLEQRQVGSLAGVVPHTRQYRDNGKAKPSSAVDANPCEMHSICQRWWPCASTLTSRKNIRPYAMLESPQKSPS